MNLDLAALDDGLPFGVVLLVWLVFVVLSKLFFDLLWSSF
jgi:hypothetical protein